MSATIKHGINCDKDVDLVFNVLKNVDLMPEWSSLIDSVKKITEEKYEATSPAGAFTFDWFVDEDNKTCKISTVYMGEKYESTFSVYSENGQTVVSQEVPDTGVVGKEQVKMDIEFVLRKLVNLA